MFAVAGLWELGWNTPIKEFDLWIHPLRDFGVDEFYMSPVSGINEDGVTEIADLEGFIVEQRKDRLIVFVDEKGETPLEDFVHPRDALYVFGKTSMSPLVAYAQPGDESIVIPTLNDNGLLWAHQAAVVVLYDRMLKWL